jgi:hypothetical protein
LTHKASDDIMIQQFLVKFSQLSVYHNKIKQVPHGNTNSLKCRNLKFKDTVMYLNLRLE